MTPTGLALVKEFEGFRAKPYKDVGGTTTVGYGQTFPLSEPLAAALLEASVAEFELGLERLIAVPITPPQWDALVSWAYNVGLTAAKKSTLIKVLNQGKYDAVPHELAKWTRVKGVVVKGLKRRRDAEIARWNTAADPA